MDWDQIPRLQAAVSFLKISLCILNNITLERTTVKEKLKSYLFVTKILHLGGKYVTNNSIFLPDVRTNDINNNLFQKYFTVSRAL